MRIIFFFYFQFLVLCWSFGQCELNNNFANSCDTGTRGLSRLGQTFIPCQLGLIDSVSVNITTGIGEYNIYVGRATGGLIEGAPIINANIQAEDLGQVNKFKVDPPYELTSFEQHEIQIDPIVDELFYFVQCTFDDYADGTSTFNGIPPLLIEFDLDLAFDLSFLEEQNVVPTLTEWGVVNFFILMLITGVLAIKNTNLRSDDRAKLDSY